MIEFDLQFDRHGFALSGAATVADRITGLFGPSGCGKTTLFHLLAGLLRPMRGRISLNGRMLLETTRRTEIPPPDRRIALVFQDLRLFPHYSVHGNLVYGRRSSLRVDDGEGPQLDVIVELLDLGPLMKRRVSQLSGGERQRVAIGRAIVSSPDLLLLDEPLASLDRPMRREIITYLRALQRAASMPMIVVSHDLGDLLQLTDKLLVMRGGQLVGHGSYAELLHGERIDARGALREAGTLNVLEARLGETNIEAGLTELSIVGTDKARPSEQTRILAPPARQGQRRADHAVTIQIRSNDIALARSPISGISIQNQLPARIMRMTEHAGKALVQLDLQGVATLHVEVSAKTVRDLELAPARPVWCLIKSSAVAYL